MLELYAAAMLNPTPKFYFTLPDTRYR